MLTREMILAADDLPREKVTVPEWGGEVWVRTLTAGQRERWEELLTGPGGYRGKGMVAGAVVAMTCCDEAGRLLFTEADIPALAEKSAGPVGRISEVALRLAKVTDADREELKKNSEASPSDSSASSSRSASV